MTRTRTAAIVEGITLGEALAPFRRADDLTAGDAVTETPAHAAAVRQALAGDGWFLAACWFEYHGNDRRMVVEVWETLDDEDEANEAEQGAYLSEFAREVLDAFLLTCPSDAALAATPADDLTRLTRYRDGMLEVLAGAVAPA